MAATITVGGHKRARKTSGEMELAYLRMRCAQLSRMGYTQTEIARRTKITQARVHNILVEVAQEYAAGTKHLREEKVGEKLAANADVRKAAWKEFLRSREDADKLVEEYTAVEQQAKEEGPIPDSPYAELAAGSEAALRMVKRVVTREGRLGGNQYLQTILDTHKADRELLGLDAEVNARVIATEQVMDFVGAMQLAQRRVLSDHPELLKEVQRQTMALIPWDKLGIENPLEPYKKPIEVKDGTVEADHGREIGRCDSNLHQDGRDSTG